MGDAKSSVWVVVPGAGSSLLLSTTVQDDLSQTMARPLRLRCATSSCGERASPSRWGRLSEKETILATVLTGLLRGSDAWADFAGHYLTALDQTRNAAPRIYGANADYTRRERTGDLADWHLLLLERLEGTDTDHLLDRLVSHPQLAGPELTYIQARRAIQTGAPDRARALMRDCLKELPGHEGFLAFAKRISTQGSSPTSPARN